MLAPPVAAVLLSMLRSSSHVFLGGFFSELGWGSFWCQQRTLFTFVAPWLNVVESVPWRKHVRQNDWADGSLQKTPSQKQIPSESWKMWRRRRTAGAVKGGEVRGQEPRPAGRVKNDLAVSSRNVFIEIGSLNNELLFNVHDAYQSRIIGKLWTVGNGLVMKASWLRLKPPSDKCASKKKKKKTPVLKKKIVYLPEKASSSFYVRPRKYLS